jgi:hypothetical protein
MFKATLTLFAEITPEAYQAAPEQWTLPLAAVDLKAGDVLGPPVRDAESQQWFIYPFTPDNVLPSGIALQDTQAGESAWVAVSNLNDTVRIMAIRAD